MGKDDVRDADGEHGCFFTVQEVFKLLGIRSFSNFVASGSDGMVNSKAVDRALFGSGVSPELEEKIDEAVSLAWKDVAIRAAALPDPVEEPLVVSPDMAFLGRALSEFRASEFGKLNSVVDPAGLDEHEFWVRALPYALKVNLSVLAGWDAAFRFKSGEIPVSLFRWLMPDMVDEKCRLSLWKWFHNLREFMGLKEAGFSGKFAEVLGVNRSQPERWMNAESIKELPSRQLFLSLPTILVNQSSAPRLQISVICLQGTIARGLHALFLFSTERYGLKQSDLLSLKDWYGSQFLGWIDYYAMCEASKEDVRQAPLWRACP